MRPAGCGLADSALKDQYFLKFSLDYPKGLSTNGDFSSEKAHFQIRISRYKITGSNRDYW
jgi:hypothetical protein